MAIRYIDIVNGEDKSYTTSVTAGTKANPCVLTIGAHPYQIGDVITVSGVGGMTQLNGNVYTITAIGATTITINVDSTSFGTFTTAGTITLYYRTITGATQANPCVVSCPSHGFTNGQTVYFTGVGGMTQLNNNGYTVANATANTFELSGIDSTGFSAFTSGGVVARPWLTFAFAQGNSARLTTGDTLRVVKTTASVTHSLGNATFTLGSATVTTAVSYVGTILVGDLIGIPTASGNGADDSFYKVTTVSAGSIILEGFYAASTTTVGGIKVQTAVATGPNPGNAIYASVTGLTIDGGWTLGAASAQDGETWIKSTGVKTYSSNVTISVIGSGVTINKINAVDSYYCLTSSGTAFTATNCTFTAAYVYTVYSLSANYILSTVRIGHNGGPSWSSFFPGSTGTTTNVVVGSYASSNAIAINVSGSTTIDLTTGGAVRGAGAAVNLGASSSRIKGGTFVGGSTAILIAGSTTAGIAEGCTITGATSRGVSSSSATQGLLIKSCVFNSCTTAIYLGQAHGVKVEGCSFANSTNYDIDIDVYSGNIYSVGNSHITPGIRAYNRAASSAPIYITNCTIDAGSIGKIFTQTVTDNAVMPQFYVQDSFFGITGSYYGRYEVVKNTSTAPPSVQLKFNTTTTNFYTEQKVASTYAKAGVAKTLGFKLTTTALGWTGTIIPKIKLNGVVIQTETTIATISYGSDDSYSYSIPGTSITQDGEISVEFLANANTIAVLVKEFTVS